MSKMYNNFIINILAIFRQKRVKASQAIMVVDGGWLRVDGRDALPRLRADVLGQAGVALCRLKSVIAEVSQPVRYFATHFKSRCAPSKKCKLTTPGCVVSFCTPERFWEL
jgi:hypothetical protein